MKTAHTQSPQGGFEIAVPSLRTALPIDQAFARYAIRHLVHKRWESEVVHLELDHERTYAEVHIAARPLTPETVEGFARALAAVSGYDVTLRLTTQTELESFAPRARTGVRLPHGLKIGASEDSPVHPHDLRSMLVRVCSEIGMAASRPLYPPRGEDLANVLDQFPELIWSLGGKDSGLILLKNSISVLEAPWFSQLLRTLDEYQQRVGSELPLTLALQQSDRELWADLIELATRRGIVAPYPWRCEVDHDKARVSISVENPEEFRQADCAAYFKAATGYQLSVRKIPAELSALLTSSVHTVRPLDPWNRLLTPVQAEQVESVAGLLPSALAVAQVRVQSNVVVAEYQHQGIPPSVLRSLVPQLERVGCVVALIPTAPPGKVVPHLAPQELEQIIERSLPSGYLFQKLALTEHEVSVDLLKGAGSPAQLDRWQEEFQLFVAPQKFFVNVQAVTREFSEKLERATTEARRFLGRVCDERGMLAHTEKLDAELRQVCGVERYAAPPHRIEVRERRDLTKLHTFTIDPAETRFREDAASVEVLSDRTRLWIHVVDLASFIPPGSPIEVAARERLMESVSERRERMPLFHRKFLLEEVSLNRGVERPALSIRLDVSPRGEILEGEVIPSRIKNDVEMTYSDAAGTVGQARHLPVQSRQAVLDMAAAVNAVRKTRGESALEPADTYALVGQLLQLSDRIVFEYFRNNDLLDNDLFDIGVPTFRRAGREVPSLKWQQLAYAHEFNVPGPALEDLEKIALEWRQIQLTHGDRKIEFNALEELVVGSTLIGKRVNGRLVTLPGKYAGVQVDIDRCSIPGIILPQQRLNQGLGVGSMLYSPGTVIRDLKVLAMDAVRGLLHVELPKH